MAGVRMNYLRPFCRDERNGHVCHRMLGHTGPHIERHRQIGDDRPDVEWFTTVDWADVDARFRPPSVHAEQFSAPERPSGSNTDPRRR